VQEGKTRRNLSRSKAEMPGKASRKKGPTFGGKIGLEKTARGSPVKAKYLNTRFESTFKMRDGRPLSQDRLRSTSIKAIQLRSTVPTGR